MKGVTHKGNTLDSSVCVNRPKKANSLTIGRLVAASSCWQEERQCAQVPAPLSQGSGDSCTVISVHIRWRRLCTENSEFLCCRNSTPICAHWSILCFEWILYHVLFCKFMYQLSRKQWFTMTVQCSQISPYFIMKYKIYCYDYQPHFEKSLNIGKLSGS